MYESKIRELVTELYAKDKKIADLEMKIGIFLNQSLPTYLKALLKQNIFLKKKIIQGDNYFE